MLGGAGLFSKVSHQIQRTLFTFLHIYLAK